MAYLRKRSRKSKKRGAGGTRKKRHYRRRQRTKRGGTIQKGQRVLFSQAGIDYYTREFHKILRPTPKSTVLTKALRQWNGVVINTYGNRVQIKWFAPHAWDNEYGRYAARRLHWTLNGGTDNRPGEGYAEVSQQYLDFPKKPVQRDRGPEPLPMLSTKEAVSATHAYSIVGCKSAEQFCQDNASGFRKKVSTITQRSSITLPPKTIFRRHL
jgi:hypothetical protein